MSVDAFLQAAAAGDAERTEEIVAEEPELAAASLHVAAVLGLESEVRRLLGEDRSRVAALLDAGADTTISDPEHDSVPLGWAQYGRESRFAPEGDYELCIQALAAR
jgi:hypothetical protein